MPVPDRVDPIAFEVIRNALLEATEEMAIALRRSAYSTNIKTRADFSCVLFDRQLQAVAQCFSQPTHLGSLAEMVPRAVNSYGADNLGPGDAILSNDAHNGGAHLNDISLISPVYCGDELFGYVANVAHHVDVGGGAPASVGAFQEIFQEGVIIPAVKLVQGGEIVPDVFRLVLAQIRSKHETAGDLRAQIAANNTGIRRVNDLVERVGWETVSFYSDELIDYTERRTKAEVAKLPRGEFQAEGIIDNDGFTEIPVPLQARIVIDEEGVFFDLEGATEQRRAPVNSTHSQTFSGCAFVLKCLIDTDIPVNAGFYRQVRMSVPKGSILDANAPAAVVGGWETQTRLIDVMFKALAPALPELMPAGTKAMQCHAGFGGTDPRTGEYYCYLETQAGGFGGRDGSDGPDAVQTHGQNTENAPIEETEMNYPLRILRYELVDDSDGAGRNRGGLGLRRDYQFYDHEVRFTVLADRDRFGPHGLFGGQPGRKASYVLKRDGVETALSSKITLDVGPDDVMSYRTCGGGGYGPPEERDPALVLRDVREGKVSPARAREVYRVVVDVANWTVDEAGTAKLRGDDRGV